MTSTPSEPAGLSPAKRRLRVEQIVIAAVVVAVVLSLAGWMTLKPGATKPSAAATVAQPTIPIGVTPTVAPATTKTSAVKHRSSKPLTKSAYLKAGNTICARMNAATAAMGPLPTNPPAAGAYLDKEVGILEHARRQLQALPAPRASAAKFKALYVELKQVDTSGRALATATTDGHTALAQTLETKADKQFNQVNARFDAFGLDKCGS